jgi:hypothetical protein
MEAQGTSWCDLYIIAIRFLNVQRNYMRFWCILFFMGNDCDDDNVAGKLSASFSRTTPRPPLLLPKEWARVKGSPLPQKIPQPGASCPRA